jgi:hypothetical protein
MALITSLDQLPEPACTGYGFSATQLEEAMDPQQFRRLEQWMSGQTMMLCDGRKFNHDTREYEPSDCGGAHGVVIYTWDVERFLAAGKIID